MTLTTYPTPEPDSPEWNETRRSTLGASEVATAAGLNPWGSPFELYAIKTGLMTPAPLDSEAADWGRRLEDPVATRWAEVHGVHVWDEGVTHVRDGWMSATPDRDIDGRPDALLEVKTGNDRVWTGDEVPIWVHCQCQWQLWVTGREVAEVAVLINGQKFRSHTIARNENQIEALIEIAESFWGLVTSQTPPPLDERPATRAALDASFPAEPGEVIDVADDPTLDDLLTSYVGAREIWQNAKARLATYENEVRLRLGSATEIVDGDERLGTFRPRRGLKVPTAKVVDRIVERRPGEPFPIEVVSTLKLDALRKLDPDLYAEVVDPAKTRTLRLA